MALFSVGVTGPVFGRRQHQHDTYPGASQSQALPKIRGGSSPITAKLVYGRIDANGEPEIERYSINGTQAYVLDDPTTG